MRVLITGGAGFVGSQLARRAVAEGHDVIALVRADTDRWRLRDIEGRLTVAVCDLHDREAVERAIGTSRPELCVHLAWRGSPGDGRPATDNVSSLMASLELVRALATARCPRFVATGTCFEYAEAQRPHVEDDPVGPRDLYAMCKSACFTIASELCRIEGIRMAWPRIFYTYGPYESPFRLVSSVIVALLEGRPIATTRGEQIRDYLHVEDVADAIWAIARSTFTGPVNVASGMPVTVGEVVRELGQMLGRPELIRIGDLPYRPNEPMTIKADVRLLRERIGWTPRYGLRQGLTQTVDWWRLALPAGMTRTPIAGS